MASLQVGSNDKLEVLADLIYLARHSPAGGELQLRCLDLAAEVILQGAYTPAFQDPDPAPCSRGAVKQGKSD